MLVFHRRDREYLELKNIAASHSSNLFKFHRVQGRPKYKGNAEYSDIQSNLKWNLKCKTKFPKLTPEISQTSAYGYKTSSDRVKMVSSLTCVTIQRKHLEYMLSLQYFLDLWIQSGSSICSQLNKEVLRNIKEVFTDLQTQVKLKLLLSFFHIPRRLVDEVRTANFMACLWLMRERIRFTNTFERCVWQHIYQHHEAFEIIPTKSNKKLLIDEYLSF